MKFIITEDQLAPLHLLQGLLGLLADIVDSTPPRTEYRLNSDYLSQTLADINQRLENLDKSLQSTKYPY